MIQAIDDKIISYKLPTVGTLSNGNTVSGYNKLDNETLKSEGWLPLEDIKPKYDAETQYITSDGYEILKTKVKVKYKIVDIVEDDTPSEIDELKQVVADLTEIVLMGGM